MLSPTQDKGYEAVILVFDIFCSKVFSRIRHRVWVNEDNIKMTSLILAEASIER